MNLNKKNANQINVNRQISISYVWVVFGLMASYFSTKGFIALCCLFQQLPRF